jgi:hypothetical protein
MARYRKIDTRMWGDSRFRELSSPGPSAKYLWVFLLTGPQTSNIPGLYRGGEMALSEELGWDIEGFRKAFAEPFAKGLVKADWNARVVWIPNAIKYNSPESPNVVKSWRTAWDEIPECALKAEAYERLKAFTKGLGEGFAKAFTEGCAKGLANQEQEQEQEIDLLSEDKTSDDTSSSSPKKTADPSHVVAVENVFAYHLQKFGRNPKTYDYTSSRADKGLKRLRECLRKTGGNLEAAVALMRLAIDNCAADDWAMNRDPKARGKDFHKWEKHLFGSYERMEGWWNRTGGGA